MYIPAALYTLLTVQTLTVFHEDLNSELGQMMEFPGALPRRPWSAPSFCCATNCSCHAQNCLSRAEARCFSSPDAVDPVGGPLPAGARCSHGHMHFPAASCLQLFCQYSNAFSRVIGSISFGFFLLSSMYNGKGF